MTKCPSEGTCAFIPRDKREQASHSGQEEQIEGTFTLT